jgi:dihydropteroate synthase
MADLGITRAGNSVFNWRERTYIMGIINLSPESFSGDGLSDVNHAVELGLGMVRDGADILDIGGESTRPGYASISADDEIRRVVPVIEKLAAGVTVPISIDSSKYEVVSRALAAGAGIINDQWGLKTEPRLAGLAAAKGTPIILMSNQRDKGTFDPHLKRDTAFYTSDIMSEVISALGTSIAVAKSAGVPETNVIIDPGLGFGKTWQNDLAILRRLKELKVLALPILLGPSRKSFINIILNLPPQQRVEGTAAAVAISIANGVNIVRVHDVKQIARVVRVSDAIVRSNE